jgi:heme A synthase
MDNVVYDDSLVLLAFLALFRIARQAEGRQRTWARVLLVLVWLPFLLPVTLASMGLPWSVLHQGLAPALWLVAAIYLARVARARSAATVERLD